MINQSLVEHVLNHLGLQHNWLDSDYVRVRKWLSGTIDISIEGGEVQFDARLNSIRINNLGWLYLLIGFVAGITFLRWSPDGSLNFFIFPIVLFFGLFRYFEERVVRKTVEEIREHIRNVAPEVVSSL